MQKRTQKRLLWYPSPGTRLTSLRHERAKTVVCIGGRRTDTAQTHRSQWGYLYHLCVGFGLLGVLTVTIHGDVESDGQEQLDT